jgi:hypothetical protein
VTLYECSGARGAMGSNLQQSKQQLAFHIAIFDGMKCTQREANFLVRGGGHAVSGWRWYLKMVPPRAFSGSAHSGRSAEDRRPLRIGRPRARAPPAQKNAMAGPQA